MERKYFGRTPGLTKADAVPVEPDKDISGVPLISLSPSPEVVIREPTNAFEKFALKN